MCVRYGYTPAWKLFPHTHYPAHTWPYTMVLGCILG